MNKYGYFNDKMLNSLIVYEWLTINDAHVKMRSFRLTTNYLMLLNLLKDNTVKATSFSFI